MSVVVSGETINSENYIMSWGRVRVILSVIIFCQETFILPPAPEYISSSFLKKNLQVMKLLLNLKKRIHKSRNNLLRDLKKLMPKQRQ